MLIWHDSYFFFMCLDMQTSLFIGCWLWLSELTVLIQSWLTNTSLQIYVKISISGTKWLSMLSVHLWLFIPRYLPSVTNVSRNEVLFTFNLTAEFFFFLTSKYFKVIFNKVVCSFTVIFQKQRNSKWRSLYSVCKKECYCGINSKVWFRRYSVFWRKRQTKATAYIWWWGTVFLMVLFWGFSFGGSGEHCLQ